MRRFWPTTSRCTTSRGAWNEARKQGAVIPLALALSHAGASELVAGDLLAAERCFIELAAIVEARGFDWSLGSLLIAAWRGQAKQTHALIDAVAAEAARQGQGYQLVFADYARCIRELGFGHYREAYASVRADTDDTSQLKSAFADMVEAALVSSTLRNVTWLGWRPGRLFPLSFRAGRGLRVVGKAVVRHTFSK
jgi:hypothetical protein